MEAKKHPALSKFVEHNKRVFTNIKKTVERKPLILLELNKMHSAHIAYSYLANVLAAENQAHIKAYNANLKPSLWKKLLLKMKKMEISTESAIYRSFGVSDFINISINFEQRTKAKKIFHEIYNNFNTKQDIETLAINGVSVGNLFYDSFLKKYQKPTIEKEWPEFQDFLLESIELFVFWEDFLDNNDVRAINVSHCVYNLAIPLRLAVSRNIPVYQTSATHIYRLNNDNLFAYNDFHYFPERFAALPEAVKIAGIAKAELRIQRRLGGEIGVDMAYSTKSAYGASRHSKLLQNSSRKKILIATHCFFDSPHSYGDNIFPDFYEWLEFLGKITEETDYDWYIKTHPDYLPGTKEIIDSFIRKYPKFTLLPPDASHHQIISEGINLVLTVYGTIGFEYAALGVPVINASQNNPHIAYDFNLHAKDEKDYRSMLIGLDNLDFTIDRQQVSEYYFMRHIYNTENLFFNSYDNMIDEIGGYSEQFTPVVYEKWLDEWNHEKHSTIISALTVFIQSGDFRMDYHHFGREFSMESIGAKI